MRELMRLVVEDGEDEGSTMTATTSSAATKVTIRLSPEDVARLDAEALSQGVSRSRWVTYSVAGRLRGAPQFSRDESGELAKIAGELRRIGSNVNQIARALNVAAATGEISPSSVTAVLDAREEIMALAKAVRQVREGKLDYWRGGDE